jgi:O-antigen/teichoic acid export membrane protein
MTAANMDNDTGYRARLGINTVISFAGKFGGLVVSLFLIPFMVSRLGDADYGLWILVTSIVAYGSMADFGIAAALTKYVSEHNARGDIERCRETIASALRVYVLIGLVLMTAIIAMAPAVPGLFGLDAAQHQTSRWLTVVMGISIGLSIPFAASTAVLHGLHRFDVTALLGLSRSLLFALGVVATLATGGGLLHVAGAQITAMVLVQILAVWLIHRLKPEFRFGLRGGSRGAVKRIMDFSWPLFMVNLGGQMQSKTDEIIIGARLPVGLITPYSFAMLLSRVPQVLAEQFVGFFLPIASELDARNERERLCELLLLGTRSILTVFLPVGGTLAILGKPILAAWVGDAYTGYSVLVWVLCGALMLDTMQWPAAMVMQGMSRHRIFGIVAIGTGLANILLSLALIPFLGLLGVALGTLVTAAIETTFVVLPYACRKLGIRPGRFFTVVLLPVVVPTLAMVLMLLTLRAATGSGGIVTLGALSGASILVYGAVFLLLPQSGPERKILVGLIETARSRFS